MSKHIIIALIAALAAIPPAASLRADIKYWNANSPASGLWSGSGNWSSSETGPANTGFVSGADSAIITQSGAIISLSGLGGFTVLGLEIRNGAQITSNPTSGINTLTLSGAGSGDLEWKGLNDNSGAYFQLVLSASTAWDGKITDLSTNTRSSLVSTTKGSRILIQNAGAAGTSTRIALNGNGAFVLGDQTGGQTVTLGELSGTSANALITSINQNSDRRLRVEQTTHTTYAGLISPDTRAFTFEKSGSGRLRLTGSFGQLASETGTLSIDVSAGEIYLNGTGTGLGTVTVSSGATLGGTGSIGLKADATVVIEDGGILNPGDVSDAGVASTGTLTITGTTGAGLVFQGNATLRFNLGGDKIILNGDSLTGSAAEDSVITFDFTGSSASVVGTTIDLIDFGGTTPGIDLSRFAASEGWTGNFLYGGDGNLLQFAVTGAPIPEPSTVALLLGLGAVSLIIHRHR